MGSSKHSEENKERRAEEEAPIGLTEAFAPVNRDGYRPGVSDEDGSPMGLTEAFAPVGGATARPAWIRTMPRELALQMLPLAAHRRLMAKLRRSVRAAATPVMRRCR